MELCLDQFGSLLSGPDSVGDVVVKLHPSSGTGLLSVSLLDLEDEGATIDPVLPTPAATVGPSPTPVEVVTKVASLAVATSIVQPSEILGVLLAKMLVPLLPRCARTGWGQRQS